MINAAQLIFIHLHQKHLKTIDCTNIKRIWTLFGWYTYSNQPEMSHIQTRRWNSMISIRTCVFDAIIIEYWFLAPGFCYSLHTQKAQWMNLPKPYWKSLWTWLPVAKLLLMLLWTLLLRSMVQLKMLSIGMIEVDVNWVIIAIVIPLIRVAVMCPFPLPIMLVMPML